MEYIDFELRISSGIGRAYPVSLINSPVGVAQETMHFPYDGQELQRQLRQLRLAVRHAGTDGTSKPKRIQQFGRQLFTSLIQGEIDTLYRASWDEALDQRLRVRIKLHIQSLELSAVPWDFLFDDSLGEYVSLSRETPIVRYLEMPQPVEPLTGANHLKILGVIASPEDLPSVDVAIEKETLERSVADLRIDGLVELHWLPQAGWNEFQQVLAQDPWHVLHFVGHAIPGRSPAESQLAFNSDSSRAHYVPAGQLARALAAQPSMRLVMLDTPNGSQGDRVGLSAYVASTLVNEGIPAVVAMQYDRSESAALAMDRTFYGALSKGEPVDTALASARSSFHSAFGRSAEWGSPALFSRAPGGVLFDFDHRQAPVITAGQNTGRIVRVNRPSRFWRLPFGEPVWLDIGAGEFWMGWGKTKTTNGPEHRLEIGQFRIAQTPITNAQYQLFVQATGWQPPFHWSKNDYLEGSADLPVTQISWSDALAYCQWLSRAIGKLVTLPSEAEWEKSARGHLDHRLYPWGDRVGVEPADRDGPNSRGLTEVGLYPETASPYGVLDMSGNIWEWTRTLWGQSQAGPDFGYPYLPDDGRERLEADQKLWRVLRGGSFQSCDEMRTTVYRGGPAILAAGEWWGFRIVTYS